MPANPILRPPRVRLTVRYWVRDLVRLHRHLNKRSSSATVLPGQGVEAQNFIIPTGATRLFLGTMDGYGWYNNIGSFGVTVTQFDITATQVSEPNPLLLLHWGSPSLVLLDIICSECNNTLSNFQTLPVPPVALLFLLSASAESHSGIFASSLWTTTRARLP
jgi:hypothetical protein